jgi:hypothetical protein
VQSVRAMCTRGWFVVRSVPGRRDGTPSGIRVRLWYHRRGSQGSDGRYIPPPPPPQPFHRQSAEKHKRQGWMSTTQQVSVPLDTWQTEWHPEYLLGRNIMLSVGSQQTFRRNISPP